MTMVALDNNDRPAQVPELLLMTPSEEMEWEGAKKHREMRDVRRREGF